MRIFYILLLFLGVGCARDLKNQQSCHFLMSKKHQRISWKNNLPILLNIDKSIPKNAIPAINRAVNTWNDVFYDMGYKDKAFKLTADKIENQIVWSSDWPNDQYDTQAFTHLEWIGSNILSSSIFINSVYYNFYFDSDIFNIGTSLDLESLMVHELGHVLGLNHNNEDFSVMYFSLGSGEIRRSLLDEDIESVICEYGKL